MLNGWFKGQRTGSGTIVWKAREMLAAGEIDAAEFVELVASSAPSPGHCNTMGTASTMNSLAEALGMSLPGSAAIPAPHRDRGRVAYLTGSASSRWWRRTSSPPTILTREAFENAIVVNSAIGGSTNAPIHINAIARHIGVPLGVEDWETVGHRVPLLVDLQPAGRFLGEEYPPGRRGAGRRQRADASRADPRGRAHGEREDHRRELPRHRDRGRRGDPHLRRPAGAGRGFPRADAETSSTARS